MTSVRQVQVTFDCADPERVARFWCEVLGYELSGVACSDPAGVGPRLYFQRVPEGKVVKNRVHLDVKVSGGRNVDPRTRERRIRTKQAELVGAGALTLREDRVGADLDHLVMADPEGNEFCIV